MLFYAIRPWQVATWTVLGLSGAAAIVYGVHRNRPRERLPWLLMSGALVLFVIGDLFSALLNSDYLAPYEVPLVVDLCYLAMFALMSAGLLGLARSGSAVRDRAGVLDAITLLLALGLLAWMFLIEPRFRTPGLSPLEQVAAVAYPLADLLLLAMVVRIVIVARWSAPVALLAVGSAGMFTSDNLHLFARLDGFWHIGGPLDAGWMLLYWGWGLAALLPSMVWLTEPRPGPGMELSGRRVVVLGLSSFIPPLVLLFQALRGPVRSPEGIALLCLAMFVLVLVRLIDAMRVHRQALTRERMLREAGVDLVAATGVEQVTEVVRQTATGLMPPHCAHRVILSLDEGAGEAPPPAETMATRPRAAVLCHTGDLPAEHSGALAGFDVALSCPLAPANGTSGGHSIGTLVVAAQENVLRTLQGAMEVLALQAALALSRIMLNDEVNRRDSEAYFRALVHNTADVIMIIGNGDEIRYCSPSAAAMFGRERLEGNHLLDLVVPEERERSAGYLLRARQERRGETTDWTVWGFGDRRLQVEVSSRDLREDPTVGGLVITLRDVTQRRRLERELTHRAFHDSLTGLANRALFIDRVTLAVDRARRNGSITGVLFIDLDDFKDVNDTLGHPVGDELLTAVAERLKGVLRPHDTAARLGGDEFAALIEDAAGTGAIEQVAERVVRALSAPVPVGEQVVPAGASVGVATTRHAGDGDELLRHADLALYSAKGEGKGQWRRYQPALHEALVERLQLKADLDRAIAEQEFSLRYQPVVGLTGRRTVGLEALVRWEHPHRGTLGPGEFIGLAEESGLIVPIGTQVVRQALAMAARWPTHAGLGPYVSINISARQFRTPGVVADLLRELDEAGLPANRLMLEIVESLLLHEEEDVWADLAQLREAGVRVAIDDFGTGYSSLSYLRQMALDVVKLDKSFVGEIAVSEQQRALVEGIVRLANTLGLEVIAEGIETQEQREILAEIGCPYGQGYLFSKPLPPMEALRWLVDDLDDPGAH
ncbi:EAL domain-containing protein [Catellatospora sp. NPDC049609]|uniref:putative bifunctional diguanylate cyclase/phosphodiesterase n=1 Tax=Catellatospora sp. NPDC049609 TaxID=3155505 RepID=UPI003421F83D